MSKVHFITPTKLSLLDITSMGDSAKRGNSSTIGVYDSGLKYSIALLLRDNVGIDIYVHRGVEDRGDWEEPFATHYTFSTYTESDHKRDKELIQVDVENVFHGGNPKSSHDMREPSPIENYVHKTGFAKALGHNWSIWMAMREIYSNMLDEGGHYEEEYYKTEDDFEGTVITLTFDESNEFYEVWKNKHLYINEEKPLYKISDGVEALRNEEGWLRIYKQNILVYEKKDVPSRFSYNIKFGKIDERRILSDPYSVGEGIVRAIESTQNKEYLKEIIQPEIKFEENEYLTGRTVYGYSFNDVAHNIAAEVYKEHGKVDSYKWLIDSIKKRKDCQIGGKIIESVSDSLWSYSDKTTVESVPVAEYPLSPEECTSPLQVEISKHYNFTLDVEYRRAKLRGSKVIADKYENCLIVDEDFSVEENMAEFIVQYIDLTQKGNVITCMSNYILNLIKL